MSHHPRAVMGWIGSPVTIVLVWLLKGYRFAISPLYGQVCRYHPTCSAYALQAVETHGAARGSWKAVRRVLRCHPWSAGGYDPVPPPRSASSDPDRAPSASEHRGEQCSAS